MGKKTLWIVNAKINKELIGDKLTISKLNKQTMKSKKTTKPKQPSLRDLVLEIKKDVIGMKSVLIEHTSILNEHSKDIKDIKSVLNKHSKDIKDIKSVLNRHSKDIKNIKCVLNRNNLV